MDFLFGLGQVICVVGLLYGAYLAITYVDREDQLSANKPQVQPHANYDPLTGHVWTAARPSPHDRLRAL